MSADPPDPCELPARILARRLKCRQLSAVDALDAHLARISQHNAALNAVVSLDTERARRTAEAADEALHRGESWGPLHGVPMTLKDGHDVAGLRTTIGHPAFDRIADRDGTIAARLRAAGANLIGHTNVPPFLADYQTVNELFGRTNNPWDPGRTAGGSSGGAAAAVAAGMTPLEFGSDLSNSIRIPAHFCGVYGLKTTEHRVSLHGFFRPPPGTPRPIRVMSSLGPLARDLDDLLLALEIVAGPDGHDADVPPVPLGPRRPGRVEDLRLAYATTVPGIHAANRVRQEVERVATEAARAGADVVERLPDVEWGEQSALFMDLLVTLTGLFDPTMELPEERRSLAWYLGALERRDRFVAAWDAFFVDLDGLILPPAMTPAFPHCPPGAPIDVDGERVTYFESGGMGLFCNLAGLPALTVPAGFDEAGLPVGVQIVGRRWSEVRLVEIAHELEQAEILPGFRAPPGFAAG